MPTIRSFAVPFLFATLALPAVAQEAIEVVIPGRDFAKHKLLTPGLTDVWKFDAEADEMLWCTVASGSFDPVLELVDAAGTVLGSNDGEGTRSELWHRAPAKGAYAFRVKPFQGSGGGLYEYHLHRFCTETLGSASEGAHTFGQEQWWHYRVALREGDVLVPTVLGDGRLTAVLDADRSMLPDHHGGYRAARTGDHFVRVEGSEGKRCQVLTQLARIGTRSLDERYAERIAPYGLDSWCFPLQAGQCVVLDLRTPEVLVGMSVREQQSTNRGPAFVATGHFDKGGMQRRLYFVRRDAVLVLDLRHQGATPAPYELALRRWGQDARIGERIDAHLPLGDGMLFHVPLQAGEMVDAAVDSEQFDASLDVWDLDGNVVATIDDRGLVDRNAGHRFLVTRPGTWHVLVHCHGGLGSGTFTLRTESRPLPRVEVGQAAVAVQWGSHLHLDLQQGECVWLSLRSATFDAALQVVDPVGDSGFVAEGGGVGGDVLIAYRASHGGRHTLIVHARSGGGDGELKVVRP